MRVGGKRRIYIPYQLAYGDQGRPPVIPEKADLVFDVELVSIADLPQPPAQPAAKPGAPAPAPAPAKPAAPASAPAAPAPTAPAAAPAPTAATPAAAKTPAHPE
jgi:peptidylprolyl isomerase